MIPSKAFILAAGLGTRMRPLTDECPKPLLEIEKRSLLEHALDHLEAASVEEVIINTHYRAEQIAARLKDRDTPRIHILHEPELLDTGGGIKNALSYFETDFFVLSGDGFWQDSSTCKSLHKLSSAWNPEIMDILMLLQPVETMRLTKGIGDYTLDAQGRAVRSEDKNGTHMFTSIRINTPHIFQDTPDGPFSYLELMDEAERRGRLYGIVNEGAWHHISTPEDFWAVERAFCEPSACQKIQG